MSASNLTGISLFRELFSPMPDCPECVRLEKEYADVIAGIHRVANGRFDNSWKKILRLRKRQEARDAALQKIYAHMKNHGPRQRYLPRSERQPSNQRIA
jgi:hypothetical protein